MDEPQESPAILDLLQRSNDGDVRAFDELFSRFRPYLLKAVRAQLDAGMLVRVGAADIVRETQLEAYRRLAGYMRRRVIPVRLWLRKTAQERLTKARRYHLGTSQRTAGRELFLPQDASLGLAAQLFHKAPSPSAQFMKRELAAKVKAALDKLSHEDRQVLLMRSLEQLSHNEVAAVLDIEPPAARKRYARALLRLRKLLFEADRPEENPQ